MCQVLKVISFNCYNPGSFSFVLRIRNRLRIKKLLVQGHTKNQQHDPK